MALINGSIDGTPKKRLGFMELATRPPVDQPHAAERHLGDHHVVVHVVEVRDGQHAALEVGSSSIMAP